MAHALLHIWQPVSDPLQGLLLHLLQSYLWPFAFWCFRFWFRPRLCPLGRVATQGPLGEHPPPDPHTSSPGAPCGQLRSSRARSPSHLVNPGWQQARQSLFFHLNLTQVAGNEYLGCQPVNPLQLQLGVLHHVGDNLG